MTERSLLLFIALLVVQVGAVYGILWVNPRVSRRRRVGGGAALFVRIVVLLWLLTILGYGLYLGRLQRELFQGSSRGLHVAL